MLRWSVLDQAGNDDDQKHEQEHDEDPEVYRRVFAPFEAPQSLARPSIDLCSTRSAEMRGAPGDVLPRDRHWSAGDY